MKIEEYYYKQRDGNIIFYYCNICGKTEHKELIIGFNDCISGGRTQHLTNHLQQNHRFEWCLNHEEDST